MADFSWPWQYRFPPFFTIQPNLDTRKKQLEAWRFLILNYFRVKKLFVLNTAEAHSLPLFFNKEIDRKLSLDALYVVLEDLREKGNVEWVDKQRKSCYIYWRTPEEWGKQIYSWFMDVNGENVIRHGLLSSSTLVKHKNMDSNNSSPQSKTREQDASPMTHQGLALVSITCAEDITSLSEQCLQTILLDYGRNVHRLKSRAELERAVTRLWEKEKGTIHCESSVNNSSVVRKLSVNKWKVPRSPSPHQPNRQYVSNFTRKTQKMVEDTDKNAVKAASKAK